LAGLSYDIRRGESSGGKPKPGLLVEVGAPLLKKVDSVFLGENESRLAVDDSLLIGDEAVCCG
jgi:hypothetical protein